MLEINREIKGTVSYKIQNKNKHTLIKIPKKSLSYDMNKSTADQLALQIKILALWL